MLYSGHYKQNDNWNILKPHAKTPQLRKFADFRRHDTISSTLNAWEHASISLQFWTVKALDFACEAIDVQQLQRWHLSPGGQGGDHGIISKLRILSRQSVSQGEAKVKLCTELFGQGTLWRSFSTSSLSSVGTSPSQCTSCAEQPGGLARRSCKDWKRNRPSGPSVILQYYN